MAPLRDIPMASCPWTTNTTISQAEIPKVKFSVEVFAFLRFKVYGFRGSVGVGYIDNPDICLCNGFSLRPYKHFWFWA